MTVDYPGTGRLVVHLRKPGGPLTRAMMTPNVRIDGQPAPAQWESNAYPVVPGRHQVEASTTYMWEFGRASLPVDIVPGRSVEVHYSSPLITLISGRMGYTQQPRPGMAAFWVILAIPILLLVAVMIGVLTS